MSEVKFSILSENHAAFPCLRAEHGLSLYIETRSANLLFDTGASRLFSENARTLRLELFGADYIALSHGHSDHVGGLPRALREASEAKLCLHPRSLHQKFSKNKNRLKSIGFPDESLRAYAQAFELRRVCLVEQQMRLGEQFLLFESPPLQTLPHDWRYFSQEPGSFDAQPDNFGDELSLLCEGENSSALICGCAHPGLPSIFEKASSLSSKPIRFVLGGSHLKEAGDDAIASFAAFFRERDAKLILGHCTGIDSYAKLRALLPEGRLSPLASGLQFELEL